MNANVLSVGAIVAAAGTFSVGLSRVGTAALVVAVFAPFMGDTQR